ncbi:MAG TPA: peptidoglycan-binding domain-containing protein [Candidatus Binatia bacterium]|nr:peptidoglycan-binding domain-containing protein [Candidatus Binatia bacterium]
MPIHYESLLRQLDRELETESESEFESEFEWESRPSNVSGSLRSLRFASDPDLQAVAAGHLRLGRIGDSPYPAPVLTAGRGVRKVQQALLDLGYALPRYGDDSRYGQETYQAVLAYKRQYNIRTASGYLDGIVGAKTIAHLDSRFPAGPLPACPAHGGPVISAESEFETEIPSFGVPWVTCNPSLTPGAGSLCDKSLPDSGNLPSEGGGGVVAPGLGQFYCINLPHLLLSFTATWEEMFPADQRPSNQRNRSATAPRFDVQLGGYKEEGLIPGKSYVRNISVTAPKIGNVHFLTSLQKNRIFRVVYSISES